MIVTYLASQSPAVVAVLLHALAVVLTAAAITIGGCAAPPRGRPRDGTATGAVLALRDHVAAERWDRAAAYLAPEARGRRDGEPTHEPFWRAGDPVLSSLDGPAWPLDAGSVVLAERATGPDEVEVEIGHRDRREKDPRPRALLMRFDPGAGWRVTGWRSW